ncbi:MAG: DNA primase, partial [Clostridiales bacterium]|nr:DNA primase [Clostridiales bacterium]
EKAALCDPPLEDEELITIWNSAKKFYKKLASQEGYIDPEQYNQEFNLEPLDYSDVGQATVLAREYEKQLRYSPSTDFLVYNGSYWEESRSKAQAISQELTTKQLEEAEVGIKKLTDLMLKNGAWDILVSVGPKKAVDLFDEEQKRVFKEYEAVTAYRKYAIKRRDSKYIYASLKEVSPMVEIKQDKLDNDEFLLNTPTATYDLRFGVDKKHEHSAEDYITKQTTIDPSNVGEDIWKDALNTFFCDDKDLIEYVQEVAGLAAIGKVHLEGLIIAYGGGRNGKSTFWNTISKILGTYSGNMSADTLTVGCKRNVKPEMAEIKGKRLVIAAELEEGMRFNTSNIKQLCSTDEIYAEKKYKEPFKFEPTHTLVLYTNHLPKVGAIDEGTWRRLIVIPFNAKIEGSSDIKNYADYLYEKSGGAILKWIMEGAKRVIDNGYHLTQPSVVKDAIKKYKENNDWFSQFLDECCEVGDFFSEKSGDVYSAYRDYCMRVGDYIRSTTDFYTALESAGFKRKRTNTARVISGLKLKSEFLEN